MRLLLALSGLAIGLVLPAIAQEQNAVDPEVRQQIEAAQMKFDDTYYKNDAAACVALFTRDAVQVWGWEKFTNVASGQQAIERRCRVHFPKPGNLSVKLLQNWQRSMHDFRIQSCDSWSKGLLGKDLFS